MGKIKAIAFCVCVCASAACGRVGYSSHDVDAATDPRDFAVEADASVDAPDADDDMAQAIAGINVSPIEGLVTSELGGTASFTVVLESQPTAEVRIAVASDAPSEGTTDTDSITFTSANWSSAQTITVTGVDDFVTDGAQTYHIVLGTPTSADPAYSAIDPDDVTVVNNDNDVTAVTVTPTSGLVTSEAGGTATFSVTLTSAPTLDVSITLTSSNLDEGTVSPGSLTFTSTTWSTPHVVTITGVDDAIRDGDLAYSIVTGATVSADANYDGLVVDDVAVTNEDDDTPGILVSPTSGLVTSEAGGTATFTVVLQSEPTSDVSISLTSGDLLEGTAAPTSLTFTSSSWSTPQLVTITGVDDVVADGDVAYTIVTDAATSADPDYDSRDVADVSVTNTDNESAGVTVAPTSGLTTTEAGGTATFTVVLNTAPTADVTISLASGDATEGTVSPASLTFTSMNWSVAQTVTVTGVDDLLDDGNSVYSIITGNTVSTAAAYNGLAVSNVTVINSDDDTAGITVNPTSGLVTSEAGGTATFTIVLLAQPAFDVTITLTSSDPTEGSVSPATLTFTGANWATPQTVTVTGVDDPSVDGTVAYTITTGATSSSDPAYGGLAVADVAVSNTDDDVVGVIVNPTSGLVTTEAGGAATYTIVLTSAPSATCSINISSSNGPEGEADPTSVTFNALNWNTPQTITVTGNDETVDDGDKAYTIVNSSISSADVAYNALDVPDVSVTNIDDDTAGITLTATGGAITENGGYGAFLLHPTASTSASVNINFDVSDNTEGVIFSPGGLGVGGLSPGFIYPVIVRGLDDTIVDGDQTFEVQMTITSADPVWNGLVVAAGTVTNIDNDSDNILITPTAGVLVTDSSGTSTLSAVLTRAPAADVTFSLASSDLTEGTVSPASLTFTSGNWSIPQTITLTGVPDGIVDGDQTFTLITGVANSADASFDGNNPPDIDLISVDSESGKVVDVTPTYELPTANGVILASSGMPQISTTGRYVAFGSTASNHIVGDSNGNSDVFRRDRQTATTIRVSVTNGGAQARGQYPTMSADGRYVAFQANLGTLVAGDTNGVDDVFVRDITMGTTTRVSLSETGTELNGASTFPSISPDGRFIAFFSDATNAVSGDTNGTKDAFVRDTMLNTTVRVNLTNAGGQAQVTSPGLSISTDGRYVAFASSTACVALDTNGASDIYVRDLLSNTTTLVSVNAAGTAAGNAASSSAQMTPDGRYVAFVSSATTLASDTNAAQDVFVRDLMLGTTMLVSKSTSGAQVSYPSHLAAMSADGQRILFVNELSLTAEDSNAFFDVMMYDRMTSTTSLVSRDGAGGNTIGNSNGALFSPDGHVAVVFSSAPRMLYDRYDTSTQGNLFAFTLP